MAIRSAIKTVIVSVKITNQKHIWQLFGKLNKILQGNFFP